MSMTAVMHKGVSFKIGDRVIVAYEHGFAGETCLCGKIGKIVAIQNEEEIGVEFERSFISGHDCHGNAKSHHGRWGHARELKHYLTDWDI